MWERRLGNKGFRWIKWDRRKCWTFDCVCVCMYAHAYLLSHVQLFVTPWTIACQAPLPMEFSRQAYWSGLPFPSPGDLSDPGIDPLFLVSPALAGGFFTTRPPGKPQHLDIWYVGLHLYACPELFVRGEPLCWGVVVTLRYQLPVACLASWFFYYPFILYR